MVRAVRLRDMATLRTLPTRVSRVNDSQDDACEFGFVLNELAKLVECPRVQCRSLFQPNRYPSGDAFEVFNGNASAGAFSVIDDGFRNAVVHICGESLFLTRQLAKMPDSGASVRLLEFSPEAVVPSPDAVEFRPRILLTFRIGEDVSDSEVCAEEVFNVLERGLLCIDRGSDVEALAEVDEVGFALSELQQFSLSVTTGERHLLAPIDGQDADRRFFPTQTIVVKADSGHRSELNAEPLLNRIRTEDSRCSSYDVRGRKLRESLACLVVADWVHREPPENLSFPCLSGDPGTAFIRGNDRSPEQLGLILGGMQFYFNGQLHSANGNKKVRTQQNELWKLIF